MKRTLFGSIALALAVAALVWYPGGQRADAQTSITRTTLSSAVTATATSVIVASATGLAANSFLYIDGELMQIQSVSSTTATVRRNVSGGASGNAIAHAANSVVWVGVGASFSSFDVVSGASCTASQTLYSPHINARTNRFWDCEQGVWLERHADPVFVADYSVRDSFDQGYAIMADTGVAKSVTDDIDMFVWGSPLGIIEYREELTKTVSSWIIADGLLDVSADDGATDAEGVEILWGAAEGTDMGYLVAGTQGGCVSASITNADINGSDFVVIGWRQNEAFVDLATPASYTLYNLVGIYNSEDGSIFHIETGATSDDSGVNWADAETRALKVCVSPAGAPTAYYSAAYTHSQTITDYPTYVQIPNVNNGTVLTAGTQLVPFFTLLHGNDAANSDIRVNWVQLTRLPR